jgi:hypothetical protein
MSDPRDPLPPAYVAGILDAQAAFHPDYPRPRVTFSIRDDYLRDRMRQRWGGFVIQRRLVIEAPEALIGLLRAWQPLTQRHAGDIARMLSELEHRPLDPDALSL